MSDGHRSGGSDDGRGRLWREVWAGVTSLYYGLFYFLEDQGILQMESELHLQVLHLVFIPLIQQHLDRFTAAIQQRPLRTEHNQSPLQLWLSGQVHADDVCGTEVTATTGIACSLYGYAATIHKWSGIGDGRYEAGVIGSVVKNNVKYSQVRERILETDVLVVEECSMMSRKMFASLQAVCGLKNPSLPFGSNPH